MNLNAVDITRNKTLRKKVKQLYMEAFPGQEQIPWPLLALNSLRKDIDLTAWCDGERFCGMTASVVEGRHCFLLFFAVAGALRDQGYGSAILTRLREEYEVLTLNVEPLVDTAPNLPQRQRRLAFYGRNGLVDTGYHVWEVGGMFRVLSTSPILDRENYQKFFKKLTFGLWNVRLEKEKRS